MCSRMGKTTREVSSLRAMRFVDEQRYFVSEATVSRLFWPGTIGFRPLGLRQQRAGQ